MSPLTNLMIAAMIAAGVFTAAMPALNQAFHAPYGAAKTTSRQLLASLTTPASAVTASSAARGL